MAKSKSSVNFSTNTSSSVVHNGLKSSTSRTTNTTISRDLGGGVRKVTSRTDTYVGRSVGSNFAVAGGVLSFFFLFMLCVSLYTKSVNGHPVTFRGLLETLTSVPQISIARSLPSFKIVIFHYPIELPFISGLLKACYYAFDSVVYLFNIIWHFLAYFF